MERKAFTSWRRKDGRQVGVHMGREQASRKVHLRGLYVIYQIRSGVAMKMAESRGGSRRKVGILKRGRKLSRGI